MRRKKRITRLNVKRHKRQNYRDRKNYRTSPRPLQLWCLAMGGKDGSARMIVTGKCKLKFMYY